MTDNIENVRLITKFLVLLSLFVITKGISNDEVNKTSHDVTDNNVTTVILKGYNDNEAYKQRIPFASLSNITLNITDIPSNISFVIVQIHAYQYNVTLSYDKMHLDEISNRSISGTNIGLFVKTNNMASTQLFIKNNNAHKVDTLLVVLAYPKEAPIPGGCNMEFNIEVAPYQKLLVGDAIVTVDFQPASLPDEKHAALEYDVYRMYLPEQNFDVETYFTSISTMLTVKDIERNGDKIQKPIMPSSPMRRIYSAYHGTGSVYAVIANFDGYSSAYVPIFTYGCNVLLHPENCQILNGIFPKLICGVAFFIVCFSIFLSADTILPIILTGGVIGYTIGYALNYATSTNIWIGLGTAILLVLLSWYYSVCCPVCFTIITSGIPMGILCIGIAYFCVKGSTIFVESDWIFFVTSAMIIIIVSLIMSIQHNFSNAVTCALFGPYMLLLPVDYYIGSSLKYIIINLIRRATVPGFKYAVIYPPYQIKDITLIVFWVFLAIIRLKMKFYRNSSNMSCIRTPDYFNTEETTSLLGERNSAFFNTRVLVYLRRLGYRK